MSNELQTSELVENVTSFIGKNKNHFIELNQNGVNKLDFAKECEFAKQQLVKNDYVLNAARLNPDSLQSAISNVAAIGISLNPAMQFAYLVPRKINGSQAICLDISYRGLTKLATDTGIIKAMKAEIVHENDDFEYHGFHKEPEFSANPFGDRGAIIGVYAMALLTDGSVLVETMTIDEVNQIRDDSEAYKSAKAKGETSWQYKNNVWVKYYGEMIKKTVIKRCYKTLPTSKGMEALGTAIDVINEHEGIEFDKSPEQIATYTDDELKEYQRCIDENDFYNLAGLIRSLSVDAQSALVQTCIPEAPRGEKGKRRDEFNSALKDAQQQIDVGS
jgi:recombination protein RecT